MSNECQIVHLFNHYSCTINHLLLCSIERLWRGEYAFSVFGTRYSRLEKSESIREHSLCSLEEIFVHERAENPRGLGYSAAQIIPHCAEFGHRKLSDNESCLCRACLRQNSTRPYVLRRRLLTSSLCTIDDRCRVSGSIRRESLASHIHSVSLAGDKNKGITQHRSKSTRNHRGRRQRPHIVQHTYFVKIS